jgi:hypothetical protein
MQSFAQQAKRFGVMIAKYGATRVLDQLRRIEGVPLASGKLSSFDVACGTNPDVDHGAFLHSFWVQEGAAADPADDIPLRPVKTYHLLLDTTDPRYCCRNNHITGPGNVVFYEDECSFERMPIRARILERPRQVTGTVAYLSNTTPDNYYHWLCLTLPLIGIYRTRLGIEPDYYYTGSPMKPWHFETLARAGVAPERVLTNAVAGERLVADTPSRSGGVDTAMLAFTRACFAFDCVKPLRRLFVGRHDAMHRRLLNEAECADIAAGYGFEYVSMSGLSVAKQAQLFAESAYIISPHGAALTNLLFASPAARILEILPCRPRSPFQEGDPLFTCFREIAAFVGCSHYWLFGQEVPGDKSRRLLEADFTVDPRAFRDRLGQILLD